MLVVHPRWQHISALRDITWGLYTCTTNWMMLRATNELRITCI
ncbi:unnamed protein product, partial [Ixodes pacificus]